MRKKAKGSKQMQSFKVNLEIEDPRWQEVPENLAQAVEKVKDLVARRVGNECYFLEYPKDFSVNLCLSDDASIHQLNREFRGIDSPTNVLSFANYEDDTFEDMLADDDVVELGDIMIAYETMQREAKMLEISLYDHFCHLWAHGLLHILGYDHMDAKDAAEMEQREKDVLAELGIADPYQE